MIEIIKAEYIAEYKLKLEFNNGNSGFIDLKDHIWGPAFEPLKNLEFFKKVEVSKALVRNKESTCHSDSKTSPSYNRLSTENDIESP